MISSFLILLIPAHIRACSCQLIPDVEKAYVQADLIAKAKVMKVKIVLVPDSARINELIKAGADSQSLRSPLVEETLQKVHLRIKTRYKGKWETDTLTLFTGISGGDCGYRFRKGKTYIVYADGYPYPADLSGKQLYYRTNICTRTRRPSPAESGALRQIKKQVLATI